MHHERTASFYFSLFAALKMLYILLDILLKFSVSERVQLQSHGKYARIIFCFRPVRLSDSKFSLCTFQFVFTRNNSTMKAHVAPPIKRNPFQFPTTIIPKIYSFAGYHEEVAN
jgi:hypothetical protein